MDNFTFVGKLREVKGNDNFKGYEEKKSNGPRPSGNRPNGGGHSNGGHGGGNHKGGGHGNGGNGGPRRH